MTGRLGPAVVLALVAATGCQPSPRDPDAPEDDEPAVVLVQPRSPTTDPTLDVRGYAGSGMAVDLFVDGRLHGTVVASPSGDFLFRGVALRQGANELRAVESGSAGAVLGRADSGRRSRTSQTVRVVRR